MSTCCQYLTQISKPTDAPSLRKLGGADNGRNGANVADNGSSEVKYCSNCYLR